MSLINPGQEPKKGLVVKGLQITKMVEQDLEEVLRIEAASFSSPWSRKMFLSELTDNPFSTLLTARIAPPAGGGPQAGLIGYCCFWVVFGEVHIMNLAVHPDWRRKRVAARLVEETLSVGRAQAVQKVHLEVRRSNEPAIRLYEKFGFKVIAVRPNYYSQPREDALLMALDLK